MAVQKPLVIIDGQVQQLPEGDSIGQVTPIQNYMEPVTVYNGGSPEVVFSDDGDIMMAEAPYVA